MPQSKGSAAAIRVKAAHRTEAGEIHRLQNTQGYGSVLATKKINNAKAWTSDEDERLRKLIISNAPTFDIAAED
jgi:hypothetical protein